MGERFRYSRLMRRPVSYAWTLHVDPRVPLSDAVREGLDYAERLAVDAQRRNTQRLHHEEIWPPPLTLDDLAEEEGVSVATVAGRIALARRTLYGNISDSGIRHRRRRQRQLDARPTRTCKSTGCTNQLPREASAARQYCDLHRTPAARVARHRRRRRTGSGASAPES